MERLDSMRWKTTATNIEFMYLGAKPRCMASLFKADLDWTPVLAQLMMKMRGVQCTIKDSSLFSFSAWYDIYPGPWFVYIVQRYKGEIDKGFQAAKQISYQSYFSILVNLHGYFLLLIQLWGAFRFSQQVLTPKEFLHPFLHTHSPLHYKFPISLGTSASNSIEKHLFHL